MSALSVNLLGSFSVSLGGQTFKKFRTKAAQALFIYLICRPKIHSREHLMTILWPELDQITAQKRLRQTLYLLRRAIPEIQSEDPKATVTFLSTDRQTVQVNPAGHYRLDVAVFKQLVLENRDRWEEAEALYEGEFLSDFYLPDNNRFEEWAGLERANLSRLYMKTLSALTDDAIARGEHQRAQQYARQQLQYDSLSESAHRQLITSLAMDGHRREAMAQHQEFAQHLEHELGLRCTQKTEELIQLVRDGKVIPIRSRPDLSTTIRRAGIEESSPEPMFNLPQDTSVFIGRETELADLESLITMPEVRLVTISGPGGIGKTRLALAYAQTLTAFNKPLDNHFVDGAVFVELTPLNHENRLLAGLAEALNLQLSGERERSAKAQILDFLRSRNLLLIMDNFEHLLESAPVLSEILKAAPDLNILVTSRERLRLHEEHVYPLSGLPLPTSEIPADLKRSSAVRLFQQAARRVQPRFTIHDQNLDQVVQICRQVDGLPLGIELAASWTDIFSPADIALELEQSLSLLESDLVNIQGRHRSMHAVFDTSWQQLNREQRIVFTQLTLFRGGFTRQALQSVTGASYRLISQLVSKSLISLDMDSDRYNVHELLRQYGFEKLAGGLPGLAGDLDLLHHTSRRHAAYYCELLEHQGNQLRGPNQDKAARAIELDIGNCRLAWDWAAQRACYSLLQQAAFGLFTFLEWRALYQEGENACDLVTTHVPDSDNLDEQRLIAWLMTWQAHFCTVLDKSNEANQLLQRSVSLLQTQAGAKQDTRFERCEVQRRLGGLEYFIDIDTSLRRYRQSLELARSIGDKWLIAELLHRLGDIYLVQSNFLEVEKLLRESLAGFELLGDRRYAVNVQRTLSLTANHQGKYREAEHLMQKVLETARETGNRHLEASIHGSMAFNLRDQGQFDKSLHLAEECYRLSTRLGIPAQVNGGSTALGSVLIHLGKYEKAQHLLEQVQHRFVGGLWQALCYQSLGMLALIRGEASVAEFLFLQSADLFRSFRHKRWLPSILSCQTIAAVTTRKIDSARLWLDEAAALVIEMGVELHASEVIVAGAFLAAGTGDYKEAVHLYSLAERNPFIANSRWYVDIAAKKILGTAEKRTTAKMSEASLQDQQADLLTAVALLQDEMTH